MASNFKVLTGDSQFQTELAAAGGKLVVVDFTSARCPPCQRIAPHFEGLASRFARAVFLKVDVNICTGTAAAQNVSATPTFIFYRNRTRLDILQGGDASALEQKTIQHYGGDAGGGDDEDFDDEDCGVPGHMDLAPLIQKGGCECLNDNDDHPFAHALSSGSQQYLESDTDEQIIMYFTFSQAVKLHSLRVQAPADSGPKNVKVFINQPHCMDFDTAESSRPLQEILFAPQQLGGDVVPLKYVKMQNVNSFTVFIADNQTGAELTRIDHFQIIGSPLSTTNMSDFKRVAGKKGESH